MLDHLPSQTRALMPHPQEIGPWRVPQHWAIASAAISPPPLGVRSSGLCISSIRAWLCTAGDSPVLPHWLIPPACPAEPWWSSQGPCSPAVARVAATEGNVLHLEEVTAALELDGTGGRVGGRSQSYRAPHPTTPTHPSPASLSTSGPPLRLSLTPRREISRSQEAGGRR